MLRHTRLHAPPFPLLCLLAPSNSSHLLSSIRPRNFFAYPVYIPVNSLCNDGFRSTVHARFYKPTADVDEAEERKDRFVELKRKIGAFGISCDSSKPGQYDLLYCPKCNGGPSIHRSLSFHISQNWSYAIWRCFNLQCEWAGKVVADTGEAYHGVNLHDNMNISRPLTVESLRLEMLDDELLKYFSERKISSGTLHRNYVMQVAGVQKIIAFTYRQKGQLVGCKYRTIEKRYWQEKNTEKLFYGLDDIAEADEIIIVEGELDKLSLEEAGYCNCVSVPNGAPQTVSLKELPPEEKDARFQYLRNCKHYLDTVSRIILATDGDAPGNALAEELARRLGRERCWRVHWPKKDESCSSKDANEVLVCLGPYALRDAIEDAQPYK